MKASLSGGSILTSSRQLSHEERNAVVLALHPVRKRYAGRAARMYGMDFDDIMQQSALDTIQRIDAGGIPDYVKSPEGWFGYATKGIVGNICRGERRRPDYGAANVDDIEISVTDNSDPIFRSKMMAAMPMLPGRDKGLILRVFFLGMDAQEAAKDMGLSVKKGSGALKLATDKLRRAIMGEDINLPNRASRDVLSFMNDDGRTYEGTRSGFEADMSMSRATVHRIVKHGAKSRCGWRLA
jgi:DNA-directed RNA polymerase specialized sigma24 family protein